MLASLHTSTTSDQSVKELLDQRARASHARYPSVSFSQCSDSPSVYSRGEVSPNPLYAPVEELSLPSGQPMAISGPTAFHNSEGRIRKPPSAVPRSPSHSDRYFTVYEDDVENDEMSFVSATTPRPQVSRREAEFRHVSGSDFESVSLEQVEEDSRMSLLGPKMRFVSRAPWETGEDDLLEANEEETSGAIDSLSIFGGKLGGKKGKEDKCFVKSPGLATFRSSPGTLPGPVKKGGSMNFGLHRRKSPELPGENLHGPYLSSASQGHGAVNSISSARSSDSVTDSQSSYNLSLRAPVPRVPSGPISPVSQQRVSPPPPSPNASRFRTPKPSFSSHDDSSQSSFRSESPPPPFRIVHPYANPDLVPVIDPPLSAPLPRISRADKDHSDEGCDEYSPPLRRLSESSQIYRRLLSPQRGSPTDIPSTSQSLDANGEINECFCEGLDPTTIDPMSHVPSQPEPKDGPMRNLISLEQARARAHNIPHLSAVNVSAPRSIPASTLVAGLGLPPGVVVENGVMRGQEQRSATIPFPRFDPLAAQNQDLQRRRPRTMSSGKHKGGNGLTQRVDGDTAPVKTLKHKKSAFMKLFQGGKDKDREKEQSKEPTFAAQPPAIRAVSTPPHGHSTPPLLGAVNTKRVPPPLLSVVVTSPSIGGQGLSPEAAQEAIKRPASPRLRQTSSPSPFTGGQTCSQNQLPLPPRPTHLSPSSSSAPPSQAEFKALSLRPISTMFNAFPDLLSPSSPSSSSYNSLTARNQNPSYPSPTTPGFETSCSNSMSTTSDYPITPTSVKPDHPVSNETLSPAEDQSVVVAMLQERIINMRKAWQRQIWELEGQVKDLKIEVEELRNIGECEACGRTKRDGRVRIPAPQSHRVVDRPRPRMGGNTRSVFGGGNDA